MNSDQIAPNHLSWVASSSMDRVREFAHHNWDDAETLAKIEAGLSRRFGTPAVMFFQARLRERIEELKRLPEVSPPSGASHANHEGPIPVVANHDLSKVADPNWKWYVHRHDEPHGPFELKDLAQQIQHGQVDPDTLIWRAGWLEWKRASEVHGLFLPPPIPTNIRQGRATARKPTTAPTKTSSKIVQSENWIASHWKGALSLPISYWVNGFCITAAGNVLGSLIPPDKPDLLLAFITVAAIVGIWQLVGIWRSANNYVSHGNSRFWAYAAKAGVILGILQFAIVMWIIVRFVVRL